MVVAQANRAFRGDLHERGIPEELHADIRTLWERYDYAFHADNTRPQNTDLVSPRLAEYLVEHFVIWGDAVRWRSRLALLQAHGCTGVMFILGQGEQLDVVSRLADRLTDLGHLAPRGAEQTTAGRR